MRGPGAGRVPIGATVAFGLAMFALAATVAGRGAAADPATTSATRCARSTDAEGTGSSGACASAPWPVLDLLAEDGGAPSGLGLRWDVLSRGEPRAPLVEGPVPGPRLRITPETRIRWSRPLFSSAPALRAGLAGPNGLAYTPESETGGMKMFGGLGLTLQLDRHTIFAAGLAAELSPAGADQSVNATLRFRW